jgi:hypothetical protein
LMNSKTQIKGSANQTPASESDSARGPKASAQRDASRNAQQSKIPSGAQNKKKVEAKDSAKRKDQKDDVGYIPLEKAQAVVSKVLGLVDRYISSNGYRTVQGWDNRLGMWLTNLYAGNKKDARTFLWRRMSYGEIKGMLTKVVQSSLPRVAKEYSGLPEFPEYYSDLQSGQIEKIGTKSRCKPWPAWGPDKVSALWCAKKVEPALRQVWKAYLAALDDVEALIPEASLTVTAPSETWPTGTSRDEDDLRLINTETNSCFPSYVRGWFHANWSVTKPSRNQREAQEIIVDQTMAIWKLSRRVRSYVELLPYLHHVATANIRTVAKGNDKDLIYEGDQTANPRLTVAMPKVDTTLGKPYLNSIIDALITVVYTVQGFEYRPFCALTTPEKIDVNMQHCLELAEKNNLTTLSTDFSGFDAHLADWFMWDVVQRMAKWFKPRDRQLFLAIGYAMIYQTSLITPDGIVPEGPSSMKSGTILTNIVDSLCNFATQRLGVHLGKWEILMQFVQGDDGLLLGRGCTPENFDFVSKLLGLVANADKQYAKKRALAFLQKVHVLGYPGGIYPITRAVNACLSLEDDVKLEVDKTEHDAFPWAATFRTCVRLNNAWADPNFKTVALLVAKDDALHLGKDRPAWQVAKMAGSYGKKWVEEWKIKPWWKPGDNIHGFGDMAINRVLRGENPPPPGKELFKWNYGAYPEEVGA